MLPPQNSQTSQGIESSNIHLKWLNNIYMKIEAIENMERLAKEGCASIIEYMQIPFHLQKIIIPDAQYKNLRFMVFEMKLLVDNLSSFLSEKDKDKKDENKNKYGEKIYNIIKIIDKRDLFLKEIKAQNNLVKIEVNPFMNETIRYISQIKSNLVVDIQDLLFMKEANKKPW